MPTILPPPNRPFPLPKRKPYTPDKPKGVKAMTIAVGFLCNNQSEVIIAVDRQFTAPGTFKYHSKKYTTENPQTLSIAFAFAGDPGIFQEFRQKTMGFLDTQELLSVDLFRQVVDATISDMGLRTPLGQPAPLYFLAGINEFTESPKLIIFNGQAVFEAESESGVHIVGCGDTSLIRYLGDHLYNPKINSTQGIGLGAYLVKKATQYVDYCGEPIDIIRGNDWGFWEVDADEVQSAIHAVESQEKYLSTFLVQKSFEP